MKVWNSAITTAINAKNATTTSSAIDCEGWDGILLTVDEDSATIAGTVQIYANHQTITAATLANANTLANWVPWGAPITVAAGGLSVIIPGIPPSIKVKWTHSGGTASVRVQGYNE